MNRLLAFALTFSLAALESPTRADEAIPPTAILSLDRGGDVHDIALRITVGDQAYHDAWIRSFDAIFDFADADASGVIEEHEARLVPSARGVRLAMGTGFVPPIDPVRSVRGQILDGDDAPCDRESLRRYYVRHGVGSLTIGQGALPHTPALTMALLRSLDADGDGSLSEQELHDAETILKRLDSNDDDLVGAGELVEGIVYPGRAADRPLAPASSVDLSVAAEGSLVLRRSPEDRTSPSAHTGSGGRHTCSEIEASAHACHHTIAKAGVFHGDAWSVRGRLPEHVARLASGFAGPEADDMTMTSGEGGLTSERPWLKAVADRNGDGAVSPDEVHSWIDLQRQIMRGHLLVSIHSGGGLFEVLDLNHDAALSVRELREAWRRLDAAGYAREGRVAPASIPGQILLVVSHGYPIRLAREFEVDVEWFGHMDRNGDGDVSRREFSGSPAVFQKLDANRDGLVSPTEAMSSP